MADRPFFLERNHVIVTAREAWLAGREWVDDGTVDSAIRRLAYEVMSNHPEDAVGCVDAVVALRSSPAGELTNAQLAARAMLDLRMQSDKDRERKRVPSSQAELERRQGRQAQVVSPDPIGRTASLVAGLKEALVVIEMLLDDDIAREAVEVAREIVPTLRKILVDR